MTFFTARVAPCPLVALTRCPRSCLPACLVLPPWRTPRSGAPWAPRAWRPLLPRQRASGWRRPARRARRAPMAGDGAACAAGAARRGGCKRLGERAANAMKTAMQKLLQRWRRGGGVEAWFPLHGSSWRRVCDARGAVRQRTRQRLPSRQGLCNARWKTMRYSCQLIVRCVRPSTAPCCTPSTGPAGKPRTAVHCGG